VSVSVDAGNVLPPGTRLGRYEVRRLLGHGGFGMVFAAHDVELDRDVALKILLPQHTVDAQIMQRFLQEARAAAKIEHPSIVTVHEVGRITGSATPVEGSAFIVMEMVRGESLARRFAHAGRVPAAYAVELGRQIASALAAAHRIGIIHRDLKPDNLMLARDPVAPRGERIKVLDFGIAKLAEATTAHADAQVKTGQGGFGTPRYMSPEQFRAAAHVDARTDVYALGCVLFEAIAGRPVFVGDFVQLLDAHTSAVRPRLAAHAPDVEPWLDALVDSMLSADRDRRPVSMDAVERALAQREPVARVDGLESTAAAVSPVATTLGSAAGVVMAKPRATRARWWAMGGGVVLAAAAVIAVAAASGSGHAPASGPPGVDAGAPPLARPAAQPTAAPPAAQPVPVPAAPALAAPAPATPVAPPVPPATGSHPAPPPSTAAVRPTVRPAVTVVHPTAASAGSAAGSGSAGHKICPIGDTLCNFGS
jgi:tRNA A-37 threonylcarbamoyl transferase component Bud32